MTFAGSTNGHGVAILNNDFRWEPGALFHGTNIYTTGVAGYVPSAIVVNGGRDHLIRGNVIRNAGKYGITVNSAASMITDVSIIGNFIYGVTNGTDAGYGIFAGDPSLSRVFSVQRLYVANNTIENCKNQAILFMGVSDATVEGNQLWNPAFPGDTAALHLYTSTSITSNTVVRNNTIHDPGTAQMGYGIQIGAGVLATVLEGNKIEGAVTGPINDLATAGQTRLRNQINSIGLLQTDGTNLLDYVRLRNIATNSILLVGANSNLVAGTIGSGLALTAGTLSATGGSGSTNNIVTATGTAMVTNGIIPAVVRAALLRGTNLWIDGATEGIGGGYYQQAIAGTAGGLTNLMVTNIVDGQTILLRTWVTNGATAQLPQFTAAQYEEGRIVGIPTNGWTAIYITRSGTETNVSVRGPTMTGVPGYGTLWATNFAANTVTQGVSTVIQGLHANTDSTVTNENSTALQINSGVLSISPGNASNFVASTINVTPNNVVSNVGAIKGVIWTNYVQTVSNFVFSFNTNYVELKNQTNTVFTNIVEEATAVRGNIEVHVHNTTGVTMGLVWPAYGAQHGYFFQTNINNPILTYTSLTTGKHGVASISCFGTNIFATWTEWP